MDVQDIVMVQNLDINSMFDALMLWNFEIYVGDSENYMDNTQCDGSPYLTDSIALS